MGNICCPKQQPQSSNLNGSVLSSALDDNSIDSSFHFKYDTDRLFFGYPKHKELTQKLYEIQNSNSSWAPFEKELQYNREKVNKYFNFLHDVHKDLYNLIINGVQAMQRVKAKHLDLPNDFKTDLEHCFIIELQEIVIESVQLEETSLMMSFRLTNPQYGIDKQYETPIKSVNKKKSIYNYVQQIPLNPIDRDQFENDGNIVPYKDYFTNFNFSIQLFQLTSGNCIINQEVLQTFKWLISKASKFMKKSQEYRMIAKLLPRDYQGNLNVLFQILISFQYQNFFRMVDG